MPNLKDKEREEKKFILSMNLRQALIDGKNLHALAESGLMPENAIGTLKRIKKAFPESYTKKERYLDIVEYQTSKTVSRAVSEGNGDQLAHLLGMDSSTQDTSYRKINSFKKWIAAQGKLYYLDGNPDSGKTNMALLMAELWEEETGGDVASNMRSCDAVRTVESFNELEDFFEEKGKKLFIFDDASNHASGYGKDRKPMEKKMRPKTNFLAKDKASIIFIGHTGKDIHADMRRKARKLEKKSIKHVDVYRSIGSNGKGVDKKMTINGVPKVKSKYDYDPYEKTKWDWNMEESEAAPEDIKAEALNKIEEIAEKDVNTIKRAQNLAEFKTQPAKAAMVEFAEENKDWRFKEDPQRLQKKVI